VTVEQENAFKSADDATKVYGSRSFSRKPLERIKREAEGEVWKKHNLSQRRSNTNRCSKEM
jgi:hypothetical protein